jgi:hypothetical protein
MPKSSRIVRIAAAGAVGAVAALVPLSVAGAYPVPPNNPPSVNPNNAAKTPNNATNVEANTASRPATLPFTGTDVVELVAIGGVSVGVGTVLVRRSRRLRTTA